MAAMRHYRVTLGFDIGATSTRRAAELMFARLYNEGLLVTEYAVAERQPDLTYGEPHIVDLYEDA